MSWIRVRPDAGRRREFARWAVVQVPKVRTVTELDFAVPAHLFTHMPEELLLGSLVNGSRYVPVASTVEHEGEAAAAFGALGGTDEPDLEAVLAANERANAAAASDAGAGAETPAGAACMEPGCGRVFDSARGLAAHQRRAHRERVARDAG